MDFKFLKHKWQKIVFKFVLIPVIIIFLLALVVNRYWSPILASKVHDVVLSSSDSLYKIDFTDAELHVLQGKITLYNITLKPDTAVYNQKKKQHLAPNNLVELHVKRLILLHVHPLSLYFRHKLNIGQIILNEPEVNISYQLNHTKDTVLKDHRTAWQKISKSLKSIHIGQILLNDVKFKYHDYSGNKVAISELKEMNLTANDLLIDSATQTDRSRLLYCKDVITELNNYTGKTASGLYTYKIKYLKLSTLKSQLNVEGMQLSPAKTDVFFNKSNNDRFGVNIDSLQLNNFDFLSYHKYRRVTASNLVLNRGSIRVFNNPNKTKTTTTIDKVSTFPNVMIHQIGIDLNIDTVRIHHINVEYSEFNHKSNKTGTVTFNNTSGHFYNITNNKTTPAKNNITSVDLTTYFMNRGKLDVQFAFNLTDKDAAFTYKGTLGPMNLQALNPAVMPLAMVKATGGTIKELSFDIQANANVFKGHVGFLYNNLKVNIFQADTANDRLKKRSVMSMFANLFVIKHDNPDKAGETPRSANVIYLRPKDSPFFKTIWKALLEGIKPCVGVDAKKQQETKARIEEHQKNKRDHKARKEARKKRKAEKKRQKELNK
ncbi:hypothetical protein SAMN05421821_111179 [Mucilaginibacter lappiensis]|uniref:AsmA-like C-terminal region n=1 Tax=Mucilaginibacter lappiensis TaxID=354630 RepID=A0ABR6PNP5_9SPHI|nr:hypothetical protein [Mucilaginibacter lappiensis]MBB6111369.1 hypothetical protein [Mucilaginibacter lappiensis]SIR76356.1 hypothetical protein SAMN05421821_111179 [Mucilaginibacter lappiensis]